MIKETVAAVALLVCTAAHAEDVDFTGTANSTCAFTNVVDGTLNVIGSAYNTATPATYTVTNNDPTAFKIVVPTVNTFAVAPGSAAPVGAVSQVMVMSTGANAGDTFTGSDGAGYELPLVNLGADNLTHSVSGSINNAEDGAYTIRVPVSCVSV